MWDDFVSRQIKRTNRNIFLAGLVLLGIIGSIIGVTWRDVSNHVFGPFAAQAADLKAIYNPDGVKHYYLKVRGEKSFQTGMREVDSDNKSHVRAEIVALKVGDRLLLVKTAKDQRQLQFAGGLVEIPPIVQNDVIKATEAKFPEMKGAFLPYMLDEAGFWDQDAIICAIVTVVLIGVGLLLVGMSAFRVTRPERHPLLAKLQQYGLVHDVRMQIDSEMRAEGGGERFGPLHMTTNWVIQAAAYKTHVMKVKDVVWAYPKITKHYHNGIPTGKTYSAILRDAKGQSMEISGKKNSVPQFMQTVQRRMPWVLIGFTQELNALWTKEKSKFMQLMEERKANLAMGR